MFLIEILVDGQFLINFSISSSIFYTVILYYII